MNTTLRSKSCIAIVLLASMPSQALAAASYSLRASVPVRCAIAEATAVPGDDQTTLLRVTTRCNAERFTLQMGGGLLDNDIVAAATDNGSAVPIPGEIRILARRPGMAEVTVVLDGELDPASAPTLALVAAS